MDEKKEIKQTEGEVKQPPKKKKFIQVYRPQNATSKEGKDFTKHGQTAQKEKARKEIENLTAMNVVSLDVVAKSIYFPEEDNK